MRQLLYGIVLFVSSGCGLVVEIVAGRLLAPYVGMSLYTWTAIIAVVLAGLSVGHWIGGRMAGPHVDTRMAERRMAAALGLSAISTLASLVLLRTLAGILLDGSLAPIPAIILLTTALFLLPSLFVGIVSPILTKIAVDNDPGQHGAVIGRMFALGTLGSIAGTLSAGYIFISWIGSTGTILFVAVLYAVMALGFAIADTRRVALVVMLGVGGGGLYTWGQSVQAFTSPCTVESDYFCIRIDDFTPQTGRPSTLMALDHLVHSLNDRDDPELLYSPYIHFVDEVARLRHPGGLGENGAKPSAFFIGGGGFTLPRAWAHAYPGSDLVVAEIDPEVTRAAVEAMWVDPYAPGLQIHHVDARPLLQSLDREPRFDVIFGDAFHDISIPAHLVTREFHEEVVARLNPGGFYALNVVDSGENPMFLMSLIKTLKVDFPTVEIWTEDGERGAEGRVTYLVLASTSQTERPVIKASRGVDRLWTRWNPKEIEARVAAADVPVLTDDFAPVDRLMSTLLLESF